MTLIPQTGAQKAAEIAYREKLVEQQVLQRAIHFADHKTRLEDVLEKWARPQLQDLRRIIATLPLGQSAKILELGSENSHCSAYLANLGYFCVATDLSLAALETAAPIISRELGLVKTPYRVNSDITLLPFPQHEFDLVFCFSCLHHFPSLIEVGREVNRILKPGGFFFFAWEPMSSSIGWEPLYRRMRRIPPPSEVGYGIHEGTMTYWGWRRAFRVSFSGFRIIRISMGTTEAWYSTRGLGSLHTMYYLLRGGSIEVVAQKPLSSSAER